MSKTGGILFTTRVSRLFVCISNNLLPDKIQTFRLYCISKGVIYSMYKYSKKKRFYFHFIVCSSDVKYSRKRQKSRISIEKVVPTTETNTISP